MKNYGKIQNAIAKAIIRRPIKGPFALTILDGKILCVKWEYSQEKNQMRITSPDSKGYTARQWRAVTEAFMERFHDELETVTL